MKLVQPGGARLWGCSAGASMRQLRKCGRDVAGRGQLGAPPGFPEGEDSVFCVLWENEWDHLLLSSKYLLPCIWGVGEDEKKPQVGLSLAFAYE